MNIFSQPDGEYRVKVKLTTSDGSVKTETTRWCTLQNKRDKFNLLHIEGWPQFSLKDYDIETDSYRWWIYETEILMISGGAEIVLDDPDVKQINDGIHYAQWKEWAGEEVKLSREDSAWVWEKLKEWNAMKSKIVPWPKDQPKRRNACTEECDTWTGPCVCGAWHTEGK